MAKINLRVDVSEAAADDQRTFTVTVTAAAKEFTLADQLSQRGVIKGLDAQLKQVVRETAEGYLNGAEDLVAGLGAGQREPAAVKVEPVGVKPKPGAAPKVVKSTPPKSENGAGEKRPTASGFEGEAQPMAAAASGD